MQRSVNVSASYDAHATSELLVSDASFRGDAGSRLEALRAAALGVGRSVRALWRLLALIGVTLTCLLRLKLKCAVVGSPAERQDLAHAEAQHWAKLILELLGIELLVRGAPPTRQALIVGNHRSYVDVAALLTEAQCRFLAKAEVGKWPIFGAAARAQGAVFVDRGSAEGRLRARREVRTLLQEGATVAAFPEGTTAYGPGMLPFNPGLFKEAEDLGVPVVPMSIEYGDRQDAWVEDTSFVSHFLSCFGKAKTRVVLSFGEPLVANEPRQLKGLAEAWVAESLAAANAELFPQHSP